ncbi:putative SWF/SNF family helicase [Gregarina niphandrodes]|uniref:SWF/SNF family helicase n=1 Tax=Gregarina niphandrodes TaxID=110365 RepID=A0A023B8W4_GRENI|nr:putative SWF/SNF family helicase [Gregarina niphandrodes]EZG70295.1 putative SWF/SNF family helicase [Gregarina niphandrodes]|eukprot:XP_011129957.1 putative SWF/SNF family helicase [Gregarina niphandrodes]
MIQKRYYRDIFGKNLEFLKKGGSEVAPNLLNAMMELRKCCVHPCLIKGAEESITSDHQKRKARAVSLPMLRCYKILIQSSGKLDKLLQKLKDNQVLIFSQMTRCLDLLSDYLSFRTYNHDRIDGAVRGRTTDYRRICVLLCTKAGGVGTNLRTVIIFDSVVSYDKKDHKMSKKDALEILLQKGAYGVLMETRAASRRFREEDTDQSLERRTKIIRHEDGGNALNTEDPALISAILSFGRVSEKNVARLTELLGKEKLEEMRSLVSKICVKKSRRKRENDNELLMYDRIVLFDRFIRLKVIPTVKRLQGMPRKWKVDDDLRLQKLVETQGLTEDVLKELEINEEIAIKRIESLVNTSVEDDDG